MSADNACYILKTPTQGGFEYRVAHGFASDFELLEDNQEDSDLWEVVAYTFKDSGVTTDEWEAQERAWALEKEIGYVEYGVQGLELGRPFDFYLKYAG